MGSLSGWERYDLGLGILGGFCLYHILLWFQGPDDLGAFYLLFLFLPPELPRPLPFWLERERLGGQGGGEAFVWIQWICVVNVLEGESLHVLYVQVV